MNILIFGASGKTGHHLVRQALERADTVTAFVRNPSKLTISDERLQVFKGDITDYLKVEEAVKGKDAVLSALGAASPFKFDQAVVDGADNIIKGMTSTGVNRLIYMSFMGVSESRKQGGFVIRKIAPVLLSTEIGGHEARENLIKKSGLEWTIVRAATLTNGNLTNKYKFDEDARSKGFMTTISRQDVADAILNQIRSSSFIHSCPIIMY